jgi:uncharacterized protein DUF1501
MNPEEIVKRIRAAQIKRETRRHFFGEVFGTAGYGLGAAALAGLVGGEPRLSAQDMARSLGKHPFDFAPKAKSVIYLQQAGGVPHIDMWDYKPVLAQRDGQPVPESLIKGERFAFIRGVPNIANTPFTFQQHGRNGVYLCNLLPHLSKVVDDLAWVHSMHTTQFNHGPAQIFQMTGHQIPGRPAFGAWLSYGIGSEAKDMPAYVVLLSGMSNPDGGSACWGSGWLPTVHQGVPFQKRGDAINFVSNPEGMKKETRRRILDSVRDLNQEHLDSEGDPEIATRISQYELAYKMQASVPGLMDVMSEPASIREMYGYTPGQPSYANNCLLARRLVERGVRFVQLCHRYWDMHGVTYNEDIVNKTTAACFQTDQSTAALIQDLKQRGLLDTTLVIWASEFGRTPMRQPGPYFGRDHHPKGYTIWMAGGGVKPGTVYGETDEFGYHAVVNPVTPYDINATALYLLGIDHTKLTYKFAGRNFRLTDVEGTVIKELLA